MAEEREREAATTRAVSVVVPARNAAATIGETLAALATQRLALPYEVIVVDDGSEDDTAAIAARATGPVTVIRQAAAGPAAARNRGAAAARAESLAFTDADCYPAPDWLEQGLRALERADLVQGRVEADPPPGPFDRTVWVTRHSPLYETANLFVTRELFERLGGFEDWLRARLGKQLAEDVWFGWRARRDGARTEFAEAALVRHQSFPRGPAAFVAERLRLAYFPAMVAKIPELRHELLYAGAFLSPRTAAFDAAMAGLFAAVLARSPIPLGAAVPYAWIELRRALPHRRNAPVVLAADLAADAAGLAALAWGSLRRGSVVL